MIITDSSSSKVAEFLPFFARGEHAVDASGRLMEKVRHESMLRDTLGSGRHTTGMFLKVRINAACSRSQLMTFGKNRG